MSINTGKRCDGYIDKGVDYSNPIVKKFVHKQIVVKTGDGEDDFIIDEKPVLVEEYNIVKEIQKQAKGTDLKSLILQCANTGDFSLLNNNPGVYADVTGYPEDTIEAHNAILAGEGALAALPDELKSKTLEELANMSAEDIQAYVKDAIAKASAGNSGQKTDPVPVEKKDGEK